MGYTDTFLDVVQRSESEPLGQVVVVIDIHVLSYSHRNYLVATVLRVVGKRDTSGIEVGIEDNEDFATVVDLIVDWRLCCCFVPYLDMLVAWSLVISAQSASTFQQPRSRQRRY